MRAPSITDIASAQDLPSANKRTKKRAGSGVDSPLLSVGLLVPAAYFLDRWNR